MEVLHNQRLRKYFYSSLLTANSFSLYQSKDKRSIVHSYYLAEHVAVRTPVADLAGRLPADLWRNEILGGASRLDAFSGYPVQT